jgi:hypothetical protein
MAKATSRAVQAQEPGPKVVRVPVIQTPRLMLTPIEKIDLQPEFIGYKIADMPDKVLIDNIGCVKEFSKELEKWEKLAVNVMKSRLGEVKNGESMFADGDKFQAELKGVGQRRLSTEKVVAKFGADALEDCYSDPDETVNQTLYVKPRVQD